MKRINAYLLKLKSSLWLRGIGDAETLAEIEGHLLEAVEQGLDQGLSQEEAEAKAIDRFGSVRSITRSFERNYVMQKILLIFAVICGLFITYVDSRPTWDDSGITAGSLLLSAGLVTLLGQSRPWLVALAVGLWLPLYYIILNHDFMMLIVLLFPLIGAYGGWLVRLGIRKTFRLAQ